MKLSRALLPFFLIASVLPGHADVLTDFFPPDTKAVFGIRVHNLAVSSLAQSLKTQAQAAGGDWLKMVSIEGFDPFRDIDEVLIASNSEGKKPAALIVVAGRFDVARLTDGARTYHSVPLLGGEKDVDSVVAFIDQSTAIAGDPAIVRAAIDRRGSGQHIDPALNDRVTSLRQRYDIWGLGSQPEGFVSPIAEAKALEAIDRFQFGIQLESGFELGAELHARTTKDAEKLNETFQFLAALLKGAQTSSKSAAKFDLQAENGTMKINVFIPEAELKKMVRVAASPEPNHTQTIASGWATSEPAPVQAGSDATPDPAPTAAVAPEPVLPPAVVPAPLPVAAAAPVAPPAPPSKPAPAPKVKTPESRVNDDSGNTVVLTLPGKKH